MPPYSASYCYSAMFPLLSEHWRDKHLSNADDIEETSRSVETLAIIALVVSITGAIASVMLALVARRCELALTKSARESRSKLSGLLAATIKHAEGRSALSASGNQGWGSKGAFATVVLCRVGFMGGYCTIVIQCS